MLIDAEWLNDLLVFTAVVDAGGFSAAAKQLGMSHSAVSKRIARIEEKLKTRLLQRTTRKVSATQEGLEIYEKTLSMKNQLQQLTFELQKDKSVPSGVLRVNAPMSFGYAYLIPAVKDFLLLYPKVSIELVLGSHLNAILDNNLDVSIQITEPDDCNFVARRLAMRGMSICASPEYFKQYAKPRHPNDLKTHNCLLYQFQPRKHEWLFWQNDQIVKVPVSGNLKVNSSLSLLRAAEEGLGIVKLPSFMIGDAIKSGSLMSVLDEYCAKDIGIYALHHPNLHLASKVKIFIDFLAQRFSANESISH